MNWSQFTRLVFFTTLPVMEGIIDSFEKVTKRQKSLHQDTDKCLANLSILLKSKTADKQLILSTLKDVNQKISSSAKEYHTVLGKCSKAIDKKFKSDAVDSVWDPQALKDRNSLMTQIIIKHLVRQGRFDLAESLATEAGIMFEETSHDDFLEMFHIQEALRQGSIQPAVQWAQTHSDFLEKHGSSLEFRLHQLNYLALVKAKKLKEALAYAKVNFAKFQGMYLESI